MGKIVTLPEAAITRVIELGQRVRRARLRRGLSVAELAAKAGLNRNTLSVLEYGKLGVALATFVTILWALGLDGTMDPVAHPDADAHGKTLEASRAPKRARKSAAAKDDYDF